MRSVTAYLVVPNRWALQVNTLTELAEEKRDSVSGRWDLCDLSQ